MPVDVVGNASSTTVPISSTIPTRAGYIFKGWCSTVPTEGGSFCPGTTYQPASNYNLTSQSNDLTLYAMWGGSFDQAYSNAGKTKVTVGSNSYYTLQDMNQEICNAVSQDETTLVVDTRDNQLYHIGKLKDNHCWTLDNLALDLINTDITNLKGKTNASDIALEYLKGIRTGTTTDQYPTAGVGTFTSISEYSIPRISLADKDVVPQGSDPLASEALANNWKVGGYYNYCAASAGTYCWGNGTNPAGSPTTDPNSGTLLDVQEDICPLGWRMPTSAADGEYQALYSAYSSDYTDFRRVLSTPLSGYYGNGSARAQSEAGFFWTSTWANTSIMKNLLINTSNITPGAGNSRNIGYSVRCIVK